MPFLNSNAGEIEVQAGDGTIIQLMALLQSFLEKNESISEIICLSLTIAFRIESFLNALKDTHFL